MGMAGSERGTRLQHESGGLTIAGAGGNQRVPTDAEYEFIKFQKGDKGIFGLPITGTERLAKARKAGLIDIHGVLAQKAQAAITSTISAPAPVVTQAPQPQAVNQTGSSAAVHGQAQPIKKKKKKAPAPTSARRSALLFDQGGGGLG